MRTVHRKPGAGLLDLLRVLRIAQGNRPPVASRLWAADQLRCLRGCLLNVAYHTIARAEERGFVEATGPDKKWLTMTQLGEVALAIGERRVVANFVSDLEADRTKRYIVMVQDQNQTFILSGYDGAELYAGTSEQAWAWCNRGGFRVFRKPQVNPAVTRR